MIKIEGFDSFVKSEELNKGWSDDEKTVLTDKRGNKYLLRINEVSLYARKEIEFQFMHELLEMKVPTSKPVTFGITEDGLKVYTLLSWCEGADMEAVLPALSEEDQYRLGFESGLILKKIHSLKTNTEAEDWETRFGRKARNKIKQYLECPIHFDGDEKLINYLNNHMDLLKMRPQTFQHGDYHIGNMVYDTQQGLSIIDFNRYDCGDPWEEFNRIVWSAPVSPIFASAQIHGYFDNKVPIEFFKLLLFYVSSNMLGSFPWAMNIGKNQIEVMKKQAQEILDWYEGFTTVIPSWYRDV